MDKVAQLRQHELETVLKLYKHDFQNKKILEIGSGKGEQLKKFKEIGLSATGVDIQDGSCATQQVEDVIYYDGHTLPFEDESFDVIFSSNALEHIPHLKEMEKEFQRVLKKGGVAIHVLPSSSWRIFTLLTHYIVLPYHVALFILRRLPFLQKKSIHIPGSASPQVVKHTPFSLVMDTLIARRHGETGNRLTEIYYFSAYYWRKHFKGSGWKQLENHPSNIFYANYDLGLKTATQKKLSKCLGSGTNIYRMVKP